MCLVRSYQTKKENMPITVNFAPSRSKKIEVDVVPAEWQLYIEQ
jgi:hypothetical protein